MRDQTGTAYTAILAVSITNKGLLPALERAQANADLAAGADQACTSGMGLINQQELERCVPSRKAVRAQAQTYSSRIELPLRPRSAADHTPLPVVA